MKTAVIVTPFYFTINAKLNWNTVEMTSQPAIMVTIIDALKSWPNWDGWVTNSACTPPITFAALTVKMNEPFLQFWVNISFGVDTRKTALWT